MFVRYALNAMQRTAAGFQLRDVVTKLWKDLANAVRIKVDGWLCITNAHMAYSIKLHTQADWYDDFLALQVASDSRERTILGCERVRDLLQQRHLQRMVFKPQRKVGYLGGKKLSGLWVVELILIPPKKPLMVLTDHFYNIELDPVKKSQWKGYGYYLTYDKWLEEDEHEPSEERVDAHSSRRFNSIEAMLDDSRINHISWGHWVGDPNPGEDDDIESEPGDYGKEWRVYQLHCYRHDQRPLNDVERNYISEILSIHMR